MASFTASSFSQARDGANAQDIDKEVWDHLKQAIASSSGFQRWQIEHPTSEEQAHDFNLDHRVSKYLRETLETLAY